MPPSQSLDTLPGLICKNVEQCPLDPFYIYANVASNDIVTITQLEFGRATHRAAHLLRPNRQGEDRKVVAIIAESDTILYHAIFAGLLTADLIPFPISHRNSPLAIYQLLRAASCHRIIATRTTLAPILARLEQHTADADPSFTLKIEEIPSLHQVYPNLGSENPDSAFQAYPALHTQPNADEVFMYVHSSGSSGLPKAIGWTYRLLNHTLIVSAIDARACVPIPMGVMGIPPFHIYGIIAQLVRPLYGMVAAVYPPTAITPDMLPLSLSPNNVLEHARRSRCRTLSTVPAFMVAWYHSPEAFAYVKTLHSIIWGGGPLPKRVGDAYADAGLRLLPAYGITEAGVIAALCQYEEDVKDWAWFRISDKVKVRWAPQGDGTFECQILATETHLPLVLNLPDVRGYATSDLCVNHPTKKHLWRIVGRLDDTLVHTSGEKTVPAPMENIIMSSPLIEGAVIFGHEHPQTGVLLEMVPGSQIDVQDETRVAELRNKIWPVIEEANAIAPGFSRLFKEMILFASSNKPLPRAGKGTVLRKASISLYAPEIDAIYGRVQDYVVDTIEAPTVWKVEFIQAWLLEVAASVCNFIAFSPRTDLRQQGFDSLTATIFRLYITKGLRSRKLVNEATAIPQHLVYSRPTIEELSVFLEALVAGTLSQTELHINSAPNHVAPLTSETVVELRTEVGVPLIVFPGVRGTLDSIRTLRAHFPGTIWGIQIHDSTPIAPYSAFASFLHHKIREKRPHGPYRLASYSGSSVLVVAVAKLLEDSGEEVTQLSFIDQFPLFWVIEATYEVLRDEEKRGTWTADVSNRSVQLVACDPLYGPASDRFKELQAVASAYAAGERHENEFELERMVIRQRQMASLLDFLATFISQTGGQAEYADSVNRWLSSVKAPFSSFTAEFGILSTMPEDVRKEWGDLGASRCFKLVNHHFFDGVGHSGIMGDRRLSALLQLYGS